MATSGIPDGKMIKIVNLGTGSLEIDGGAAGNNLGISNGKFRTFMFYNDASAGAGWWPQTIA